MKGGPNRPFPPPPPPGHATHMGPPAALTLPIPPLEDGRIRERPATPGASSAGKPRLSDDFLICPTAMDRQARRVILVSCADGRYSIEDPVILRAIGARSSPDRYSPPGGPGAFHTLTCARALERDVDLGRLRFLVTHHATDLIILAAHEDCAFYAAKFPYYTLQHRFDRQLADLIEVARDLRQELPNVRCECVYVRAGEPGTLNIYGVKA